MLTKREKNEILKYHASTCRFLIASRKNSDRVPAAHWVVYATKRFEGRLIAIRKLVDLLGLPRDFLPNRDNIIV